MITKLKLKDISVTLVIITTKKLVNYTPRKKLQEHKENLSTRAWLIIMKLLRANLEHS